MSIRGIIIGDWHDDAELGDSVLRPDTVFAGAWPSEVRAYLQDRFEEPANPIWIVTRSPLVVSIVTAKLRELRGNFEGIFLGVSRVRWKITNWVAPEWLAHFDIGDLFARGAMDGILGISEDHDVLVAHLHATLSPGNGG